MAAVATQLTTGTSTTATTTVSFTAQSAGTLLLLWVASDDYRTTGANTPESSSFTLFTSQQVNAGHYLWYKYATGSETSVKYTIGSATGSAYVLTTVTGVDSATTPLGSSNAQSIGTNTSWGTPSVTPTSGSDWIVFGSVAAPGSNSSAFSSWSGGFTQMSTVQTTTSYKDLLGVADLNPVTGGTATSTTATWSPSKDQGIGITAAFKISTGGGTNGSVTAVPATASAAMPAPAVAGTSPNANVGAAPATASAAMPDPVVTVTSTVTGGGPPVATATMPAPVAHASSTVAAVHAGATATMPTPNVSGSSSVNGSVNAVAAHASAAMAVPTLSAAAAIQGLATTASAVMAPPVLHAGASIQAVATLATATMPAPTSDLIPRRNIKILATTVLVSGWSTNGLVSGWTTGPLGLRHPHDVTPLASGWSTTGLTND